MKPHNVKEVDRQEAPKQARARVAAGVTSLAARSDSVIVIGSGNLENSSRSDFQEIAIKTAKVKSKFGGNPVDGIQSRLSCLQQTLRENQRGPYLKP